MLFFECLSFGCATHIVGRILIVRAHPMGDFVCVEHFIGSCSGHENLSRGAEKTSKHDGDYVFV